MKIKHDSLLRLENITQVFSYRRIERKILDGMNFSIARGEHICIYGPSGIGKTTFLQILGLLHPPDAGKIYWHTNKLSQLTLRKTEQLRRKNIGYVYQFHHLLKDLTVRENILLPLALNYMRLTQAMHHRLKKYLQICKLEQCEYMPAYKLSGGEEQRVALIRALIHHPDLIIADEPTGNLDAASSHVIIDLLMSIAIQYNIALVIATHDESIQKRFSIRYTFNQGRLIQT